MPPKRTPVSRPTRTPPSTAGSEGSQRRKSARKDQADASWTLPSLPDSILMRPPERWVCVHFKLLHVSLLDDVVRLPPNATLHTLEAKLISHHGGAVKGIELYKDDTQPKNKLRDFSLTLKDAFRLDDGHPSTVPFPNIPSSSGVGPALVLSPEDHHVTVCYDFKSHDSDCPLLNRSPRYRSGQPPYGSEGSSGGNNTTSGGHSSTSRFLNTSNTAGQQSSPAPSTNKDGGSESASRKPGSSHGDGNKSENSSSAAGAAASTQQQGSVGLTAPLTVDNSGSSGAAAGVGVGSGRGSTKS